MPDTITVERFTDDCSTAYETDDVREEPELRAVLDVPYEATDDLKSLDWEAVGYAWDEPLGAWTVRASALETTLNELDDMGYDIELAELAQRHLQKVAEGQ